MKPDITKKKDIEVVMTAFYSKVKADKTIGFFFKEMSDGVWLKHLEKMCSFWENVLFFTGDYEGNPMETHRQINQKQTTEPIHFQRWMKLFNATIDEIYEGANASKMKEHALAISAAMLRKL